MVGVLGPVFFIVEIIYVDLRQRLSIAWTYYLNEAYLAIPTRQGILYHLHLSPGPRTFEHFSRLPSEVRALIWELALPVR
jgi:hypothetical protein